MIIRENLEKMLLLNWSNFLDLKKLREFMISHVGQQNGLQLKFSKFELTTSHFVIWIEFKSTNIIGTTEAKLYFDGTLEHVETVKSPT